MITRVIALFSILLAGTSAELLAACPSSGTMPGAAQLSISGLRVTLTTWAECRDAQGDRCSVGSDWIEGTEQAFEPSGFAIIYRSFKEYTERWDSTSSTYGEYSTCYRGRLEVRTRSGGNSCILSQNTLTSAEYCTPSPPPSPPPPPQQQYEGSPILIDLDGNGFHLAGPDDPVLFDLDGDGSPELWTWTSEGTEVAILCIDLNSNGTIDGGLELAGKLSPRGERARVGYDALAEYDLPAYGGNADGVIGPEDAVYSKLLLWVDSNHDGISEPNELRTLSSAGVLRLDLNYIESSHRDRHGNLFRYKSRVWFRNPAGQIRITNAYDVFFYRVR